LTEIFRISLVQHPLFIKKLGPAKYLRLLMVSNERGSCHFSLFIYTWHASTSCWWDTYAASIVTPGTSHWIKTLGRHNLLVLSINLIKLLSVRASSSTVRCKARSVCVRVVSESSTIVVQAFKPIHKFFIWKTDINDLILKFLL
jgi:hypothetical protein